MLKHSQPIFPICFCSSDRCVTCGTWFDGMGFQELAWTQHCMGALWEPSGSSARGAQGITSKRRDGERGRGVREGGLSALNGVMLRCFAWPFN